MSEQNRTPSSRTVNFGLPKELPESLPVLPLRQGVVLPGGVGPLTLGRTGSLVAIERAGRPDAERLDAALVLVATQREPTQRPVPADLHPVAVLARILEVGQAPGRAPFVVVVGLARVVLTDVEDQGSHLEARFEAVERSWPMDSSVAEAVFRTLREEALALSGKLEEPAPLQALVQADLPRHLWIDALAALLPISLEERQGLLLESDPVARAEVVLRLVRTRREVVEAEKAVRQRVQSEVQGHHKEAILRQQLKAIQEELGDGDGELADLDQRLRDLNLPEAARKVVDRERARLARLRDGSPERSVAVDWLEQVADLPWGRTTARPEADLEGLERALEASHFGLEEVKRQVVEHLAVRQLAGAGRADVLLLVGPPGVGKTSIGEAIAAATGRKLVRVALGGVRDEAEIRGHRRTYIGARPGRIIEGLRRAGAADPVFLLDEIDKLGAGWQGDPGAALLELLDPEQNHAFTDHYLELPFDLSKALFVATANDLARVPAPLLDRMEVLKIDGYTLGEKVKIVRGHLLERLALNAGVELGDVEIEDSVVEEVILGWTREAGVRGLQRTLGRIYRAVAVKKARGVAAGPTVVRSSDLPTLLGRRRFREEGRAEASHPPGVATGLAWTPVGGDVLFVEAATLPGNGRLVLTGQLGDVMKESARAALTYALSHADLLGFDGRAAEQKDVHIHVPAGAVPKDGPSAGVTMFTALASLLSGRPVRSDVAMTGEATLRGRVLPVGGIKSKVLAACRHGVKRVILPRGNADDLDELPASIRESVEFVLVQDMGEVLEAALVPQTITPANVDVPVADLAWASAG